MEYRRGTIAIIVARILNQHACRCHEASRNGAIICSRRLGAPQIPSLASVPRPVLFWEALPTTGPPPPEAPWTHCRVGAPVQGEVGGVERIRKRPRRGTGAAEEVEGRSSRNANIATVAFSLALFTGPTLPCHHRRRGDAAGDSLFSCRELAVPPLYFFVPIAKPQPRLVDVLSQFLHPRVFRGRRGGDGIGGRHQGR